MYQSDKLEFVVNQSIRMEEEAKFADVILLACTTFKRWDIGEWANCSGYIAHSVYGRNHRIIALESKCIEPLGESKPDYEIFSLVADKLGFSDRYKAHGRTDLDWVKRMFDASDLPKHISWKDFEKKGCFIVPVPDD
jgi:trimethylamine-N-oxide reductase (cytochrome c)